MACPCVLERVEKSKAWGKKTGNPGGHVDSKLACSDVMVGHSGRQRAASVDKIKSFSGQREREQCHVVASNDSTSRSAVESVRTTDDSIPQLQTCLWSAPGLQGKSFHHQMWCCLHYPEGDQDSVLVAESLAWSRPCVTTADTACCKTSATVRR